MTGLLALSAGTGLSAYNQESLLSIDWSAGKVTEFQLWLDNNFFPLFQNQNSPAPAKTSEWHGNEMKSRRH